MQLAALERLVCLVKAGSRIVPLVTPAFQFSSSAKLQRRCSFPFGSLRLPRVPLGGFATSRSPLAAVAARGEVYIHASTTGLSSAVEKASPTHLHSKGVEAPTEAVVTLTPTKFTFELESEPENV